MDETNKNDFPLKVLDWTTQLDMIEKKLDAIINHLGIEFQDTSREAVANNKELADFHGARCQKNEFLVMVRDYLTAKEKDHDDICIKVLQPWSFDVRSTNLKHNIDNKVTLWGDEKGDHFKARLTTRNNGFTLEIDIRRFPLISDDTGVIADITNCNFFNSLADAIINHKIEISELGSFDTKKCRSISEDFDEWWFLCLVGDTTRSDVRVLKKIDLAVNGEFVGSLNPVGSTDLTEITITRYDNDTADFTLGNLAQVIGVNFNKLGRFLYHCILMEEIEIPGFTEWRKFKYNGPAIPE